MFRRSPSACSFFLKPLVFFLAFLVILSLIRIAFFAEFRTGDFGVKDFLPAFWMGVRIDAKWLATLILPAWICWLMSAKWPKAKKEMGGSVRAHSGRPDGAPRIRQH